MNNFLGRAFFRVIDVGSGLGIARRFRLLSETQYWAPDRLRELQRKKLKQVLAHARQNVPFYAERFADARSDALQADPYEILARLPVMTKRSSVEKAAA